MRSRISRRRGGTYVQWIVIASVIVAALVGTWATLGPSTNTRMEKVAEGVGDPTKLTQQFGSQGS